MTDAKHDKLNYQHQGGAVSSGGYGPAIDPLAAPVSATILKIGGRYNWKNQPERLIYTGLCEPRNGRWHQFELVDKRGAVWCEVLDGDLHMMEETPAEPVSAPTRSAERMKALAEDIRDGGYKEGYAAGLAARAKPVTARPAELDEAVSEWAENVEIGRHLTVGARPASEPLRAALLPFVAHYADWMDNYPDDIAMSVYPRLTYGQVRAARAALARPSLPVQEEEPPGFDRATALILLSAASKSGNEGAIRLAAQLAGAAPCDACGYVNFHCRCAAPAEGTEPATVPEVWELNYCESQRLSLHPGILYRFKVDPECASCTRMAAEHADRSCPAACDLATERKP